MNNAQKGDDPREPQPPGSAGAALGGSISSKNVTVLAALEAGARAMDDWARSYAPECCDSDGLDETRARINERGTLAYIAHVARQLREATALLSGDGSQVETVTEILALRAENANLRANFTRIMTQSADETKAPPEVTGWVIEGAWSPTNRPEYWVGSSAWSTGPYEALRFLTRKDAEQAASFMCDGLNIRICEHSWVESSEETSRGGPIPDALKPPVRSEQPCPTGDWVHEERNGKCIYCGAPMPSQSNG